MSRASASSGSRHTSPRPSRSWSAASTTGSADSETRARSGQASADTFDLATQGKYWQSYFPGYTLVAYDDRGTGKSGALDCSSAVTIDQCAADIPNRAFYTTRDHAFDIESVRVALGVDKLA